MNKFTIKFLALLIGVFSLFSVISVPKVEAANPYIQNVFFGQDENGDYISFDWVSIPPNQQEGGWFGCTRDMVSVWFNRSNPNGTTEGSMTIGFQPGDFIATGGGNYSGFGNYAFASGLPDYSCATNDPNLNERLPVHIKTYINPGWSPERLSFSGGDFITIQLAGYKMNIGYSELLVNDSEQYFYQVPNNPLPVIPYANVKFGFDENDLLKVSFDWVGPSRNITPLVGFNGKISYPFYAHFEPDPEKDVSMNWEDGHNENLFNVNWFTTRLNVQKGQHYDVFVNELHKWTPSNQLRVCSWYYPCPVNRTLVESILERSFKPDDYITIAFNSSSPSQPSDTQYILTDPNKYYFNPALPSSPPPRQIEFVHGITTSFRDVQNGIGGFQSLLLSALPAHSYKVNFFAYYQDLGYIPSGCATQPLPNTNTAPLFTNGGTDQGICDSQSAIAYNATRLDDELSKFSPPVTVIAYSMGAATARGWLTLAQNRPNDPTLHIVDTLITIQGAQQGSYLAGSGAALAASSDSWSGPIWDAVISAMDSLLPWNIYRPAVNDLAPASAWYQSVNPTNVPSNLHYFNFYSNIQATVYPQLFFVTLPPLGTISFGDDVLLPGDPNPAAIPLSGGARFLPGGLPTADRYEYKVSSDYSLLLGNDLLASLLNTGSVVYDIINDPIMHLNLNQHLNDTAHKISSCSSNAGQLTIQDEILRILPNPGQACNN